MSSARPPSVSCTAGVCLVRGLLLFVAEKAGKEPSHLKKGIPPSVLFVCEKMLLHEMPFWLAIFIFPHFKNVTDDGHLSVTFLNM